MMHLYSLWFIMFHVLSSERKTREVLLTTRNDFTHGRRHCGCSRSSL